MGKTVKLINEEGDLIGRTCLIEPNSKSATGYQIVKNGKTSKLESDLALSQTGGRTIAEYHIPLTLDTLREIDSDKQKLKNFLDNRLSRIKTSSFVNMMIVKLKVEGAQRIVSKDVDYLWDMLQVGGNDIIVTPLIEYPKGTVDEIAKYSNFIQEFLKRSSSTHHERIACSIPYSASRGDVDDIVGLFRDITPQVYVLDFGGKKPFDSTEEIIMSSLLRNARKVSEDHGYDFYLYGYDVKPFTSGAETQVAQNMMLAGAGFNAVGPRHTVPPMRPEILLKLAAQKPNPLDRTKVFELLDLGYHTISDVVVKDKFLTWAGKNKVGIDLANLERPEYDNVTRALSKAYSYSHLLPGAINIDQSIEQETLKKDLESKVLPRELVKRIVKIKKGAKGVQKHL